MWHGSRPNPVPQAGLEIENPVCCPRCRTGVSATLPTLISVGGSAYVFLAGRVPPRFQLVHGLELQNDDADCRVLRPRWQWDCRPQRTCPRLAWMTSV